MNRCLALAAVYVALITSPMLGCRHDLGSAGDSAGAHDARRDATRHDARQDGARDDGRAPGDATRDAARDVARDATREARPPGDAARDAGRDGPAEAAIPKPDVGCVPHCGLGLRCVGATCVCDQSSGCLGCCRKNTCVTQADDSCGLVGKACNDCKAPSAFCQKSTGLCCAGCLDKADKCHGGGALLACSDGTASCQVCNRTSDCVTASCSKTGAGCIFVKNATNSCTDFGTNKKGICVPLGGTAARCCTGCVGAGSVCLSGMARAACGTLGIPCQSCNGVCSGGSCQ